MLIHKFSRQTRKKIHMLNERLLFLAKHRCFSCNKNNGIAKYGLFSYYTPQKTLHPVTCPSNRERERDSRDTWPASQKHGKPISYAACRTMHASCSHYYAHKLILQCIYLLRTSIKWELKSWYTYFWGGFKNGLFHKRCWKFTMDSISKLFQALNVAFSHQRQSTLNGNNLKCGKHFWF